MGIAEVQFHSEALGKQTSYTVILPEIGTGPFPVLIQLHGLSDDHHAWVQRSNLVRYAGEYPLVVVLPDGGTSGYLNWTPSDRLHKHNYEDLIVRDIPRHVRRHFNVTDGRWAIGGLSMGGYGAMRLGLKHPEMFASIWAHSSAFHIDHLVDPALVQDAADADVLVHAEQIARRADRPAIAFDCGVDDEGLIDHNRALHARMDALEIPHHYAEHPGGHTWDYWDEHVREALAQHARVLGLVGVG
ncbi:MAG TPA: alpha/beta hydrolase family protein [Thermomicrobiales bacterium]|nr:alpha/beta hydrolase family protein [Thermomicrobiales bacterium]